MGDNGGWVWRLLAEVRRAMSVVLEVRLLLQVGAGAAVMGS